MRKVWSFLLCLCLIVSCSVTMFSSETKLTQKQVIENFKNGMYIGDWVPSVLSEQTVKEMAECGIQYTFLWYFDYNHLIDF